MSPVNSPIKAGFTASVHKVAGKFLFVGLAGSGKTTLLNLMSGDRRFQQAANLDFMLGGREGGTLVSKTVHLAEDYERALAISDTCSNYDSGNWQGGGAPRRPTQTAQSIPNNHAHTLISGEESTSTSLRERRTSLTPPSPTKRSGREGSFREKKEVTEEEKKKEEALFEFRAIAAPPPVLKKLRMLPLPPPSTSLRVYNCFSRGFAFSAVDVPGRPAYRHQWYDDLQGVCCVVLVVDVSDRESLPLVVEQVRRLGSEGGGGKLPVLVLGNKMDLVEEGGEGGEVGEGVGIRDEKELGEVLQLEKWLRNGDRMWTVRMVSAVEMDTVAQALLWAVEERFRF